MEITTELLAKKGQLEKWITSHDEDNASWAEIRAEYVEICRLINDPIPIREIPFFNSKIVACNKCNGKGRIITGVLDEYCPLCGGDGLLKRISEGVIKLYKTQ